MCRHGARWGHRTPKSKSSTPGEDKKDFFFGYEGHAIADAYYGLPLHMEVTPARKNETTRLPEDLRSLLGLNPHI